MLICWCEIIKWLKTRTPAIADEWTAAVVVLFGMAVPFIDGKHSQSSLAQRRKKAGILRSSSGSAIDMTSWETMIENEISSEDGKPAFMRSPGWNWILQDRPGTTNGGVSKTPLRSKPTASTGSLITRKKNTFLVRCAALAREFLQTPAGEGAI